MIKMSMNKRLLKISLIIGLIIAGLIWGITSQQVTYSPGPTGNYTPYTGQSTGNLYLHLDGTDKYYVALNGDFTPNLDANNLPEGADFDFVTSSQTSSVDVDLDGTTLTEAYTIEKITFTDDNDNIV